MKLAFIEETLRTFADEDSVRYIPSYPIVVFRERVRKIRATG